MRLAAAWLTMLVVPAGVMAAVPTARADRGAGSAAARSDYVEHCGGCHGVTGSSAPARVPQLRGRVGYFLCTRDGRDYLVRLPNVAHAALPDAEALAGLLNYVVFDLGGASAPAGAASFAGAEVASLRTRPLVRGSLVQERARIVAAIRRRCPGTPPSLEDWSGRPAGASTRLRR